MTLIKRGKVWYGVLRHKGKQHWRRLHENEVEAGRLQAEWRDGLRASSGQNNAPLSWREFKRIYFKWAQGEKDPNTITHETQAIIHLESYAIPSSVQDVSPQLLAQVKSHLKGRDMGVAIRNRRIRALKTIMRWAEAQGYVKPQLWRIVKKDQEPPKSLVFYTPTEFRMILEDFPEPYKTCAILGARAGLRIGESAHLRWEDVHWATGQIEIVAKSCDCKRCSTRGRLWKPKAKSSGMVPMDKTVLLPHLAKRRKPSGWVVQDGDWRPSLAVLEARIAQQIADLDLRGSSHTFRHTFASWLVQDGVPLYDVQRLLRHADIKSTQIYAHLAPHNYERAVARLPNC